LFVLFVVTALPLIASAGSVTLDESSVSWDDLGAANVITEGAGDAEGWSAAGSLWTPGPPVVENANGPADLTASSARLTGMLSTGGVATAYICWQADSPAGTDTGDWENVIGIGTVTQNVEFVTPVTGLLYGVTYYYRCYATNAFGGDWADSITNFLTPPPEGGAASYARIDIGASSGRTDTGDGWQQMPGTLAHNSSGNVSAQAMSSDSSDAFTIAVDNVNISDNAVGTCEWRDRGNSSSSDDLVYVAEDLIKNDNGIIRVTLGSIPAGDYDVISYHVDPGSAHSDQIEVKVSTDGGTTYSGVLSTGTAGANIAINSLTTANIDASKATFSFTAGGSDEVMVVFDGTPSGDDETSLNGLVISNILAGAINITNRSETGISTTGATFNATLSAPDSRFDVYLYWGTNDAGSAEGLWGNTNYIASHTNVASTNITFATNGLAESQQYYYTFKAQNDATNLWASPSITFATIHQPDVNNSTGATPAIGYATLNGNLSNGSLADVHVYWGTSDGETNTSAWANTNVMGELHEGDFSTNTTTDLLYGITYYYRCYATNVVSTDWADTTATFLTLDPGVSITNNAETGLTTTSATFNATLHAPGSTFDVHVYWGTNDGGIAAGDWRNTNYAGSYTDLASTNLSFTTNGLAQGQRYHYAFMGQNAATNMWASPSITFKTVHEPVINNSTGAVPAIGSATLNGELTGGSRADVYVYWGTTDGETNAASWASTNLMGELREGAFSTNTSRDLLYGVTYYYRSYAINAVDADWADSTAVFLTLDPGVSITNNAETGLSSTSAAFNVTLEATGSVFHLYAYWGTNDGGAAEGIWGNTNYIGSYSNVASSNITFATNGLAVGGTYHYTFMARNDATNMWATPSISFTTIHHPAIDNSTGSVSAVGYATLNGELTDGVSANVYVYWGATDGETNGSAWANTNELGELAEGLFSSGTTTDLLYGVTHYYRCYATNELGHDWADSTVGLTTLPPVAESHADGLEETLFDRQNISGANPRNNIQGYIDAILSGNSVQGILTAHLDYQNDAAFDARAAELGSPDWDPNSGPGSEDFSGLWVCDFTPTEGGAWGFRFNGCDDNASMWIDDDQNGVFESTADRFYDRGCCGGSGDRNTPSITAGQTYRLGFVVQDTGGGGHFRDLEFKPPSGSWTDLDPGDPAQAGLWQYSLGVVSPALAITNRPATSILAYTAELNAGLAASGAVFDIYAFWGQTNESTNASSWATNAFVGSYTNFSGNVSYPIAGLLANTSNYFTFKASNMLEEIWATNVLSFKTLEAPHDPAVTNIGFTAAIGTATLMGELTDGSVADIYLYWGTTDVGTNATAWAHTNFVGEFAEGTFETDTTDNLLFGVQYYYRCYATNEAAANWADATSTFSVADPSGDANRLRLRISFTNHTGGPLTNFPALVRLSTNIAEFAYDAFLSDAGNDLRFWNDDESTELNYEIEDWNTNGTSYVWVQIREFTNNCHIWASWGDVSATNQEAYSTDGSVWSEGFGAVWHMSEAPGTATAADSTTNGRNGTLQSMDPPNDWVAGSINGALDFDGGDDWVSTPYNIDETDDGGGATFSAWVYPRTADGDHEVVFSTDNGGWDWTLELDSGSGGNWEVFSGENQRGSGHLADLNRWQHVAAVYDPSAGNIKVYKNGQPNTVTFLSYDTNDENLRLGNDSFGSFDGIIDEARASQLTRSADWIMASYSNQCNGSTFATYEASAGATIQNGGYRLGGTTTVINATLYASNATYNVIAYWNTTDGGTNATAWTNSHEVGTFTHIETNLSTTATGLTMATPYYFTFRATNVLGADVWAEPSVAFTTLEQPSVTNAGATPAIGTAALNGELIAGTKADVYVFWGTTDGGTNAAAWANTNALGELAEGPFAANQAGLLYGLTYYYRCYAANLVGEDWADSTEWFTTPPMTATGFYARIDIGASGGRTDTDDGWQLMPGTPGHNSSVNVSAQPMASDSSDAFTIAVDNVNTGGNGIGICEWRDRGNSSSSEALVYTAEDLVKNDSGIIRVTLGSIPRGEYHVTSYHVDPGSAHSDQIDVRVSSDGGKTYSGVLSTGTTGANIALNNLTAAGIEATRAEFSFTASGTDDVRIVFDGTPSADDETPLNGLVISNALANPVFAIFNTAVSDLSTTSATLNATLEGTGSVFDVYVYWGTNEGGAAEGTWGNTNYVGSYSNAASTNVGFNTNGLVLGGTYHYTFQAQNPFTNLWASPSTTFRTVHQPVLNNAGGGDPAVGFATLNGDLTGGSLAEINVYWGDADGETNAAAWGNTNVVGEISEGAFATDTTNGLLYGIQYYYRCYATNEAGEAWAGSTAGFVTAPLSQLITNGLLAHWDAGSIKDLADGAQVESWENSQNPGTYDLTRNSGGPTYVASETDINDMPAVFFSNGGNDSFSFSKIDTMRTVFWVLRDSSPGDIQFLFGDGGSYHFHGDDNGDIWHPTHTHNNIKNGSTELNGVAVNGTTTPHPTDFSIISVVTLGNVEASRLSYDRGISGRSWEGEIAEILVYDVALSSEEEDEVGGYLATKYGLTTAYPPGGVSIGIFNAAQTDLSHRSATFNATLAATQSVFDVYVYWGTNDGVSTTSGWDNTNFIGWYTNIDSTNLDFEATELTHGTQYYYTFLAQNAAVDAWASPSISFMTDTVITNTAATDMTFTSGLFNAMLYAPSNSYDLSVYWGTNDGGTTEGAWGHTNTVGSLGNVASTNINYATNGMEHSTRYYYTFCATEGAYHAWARPSTRFFTHGRPFIENIGATAEIGYATMSGELLSAGGATTTVHVYWGESDGGTNAADWAHTNIVGERPEGTFDSDTANGLIYGVQYYYRCYAINSNGMAWADSTVDFSTLPPVVATGPNSLNYAFYDGAAPSSLQNIDDGVVNGDNGGLFDLQPSPQGSWPTDVRGKTNWTGEVWQDASMSESYCQMWWGVFRPPLAGTYEFYMSGDDWEILWIDRNQNSEFEAASGEDISRNVKGEEGWNTPHTETVGLTNRQYYAIAIAFNEEGGGDILNLTIKKPGGTAERINPSAPGQEGWWYRDLVGITDIGVLNQPASLDYASTTATFNATLYATGSLFDVNVYWGTNDGGTEAVAWTHTNYIGSFTNVVSTNISYRAIGLDPNVLYYYTFSATNIFTNIWASPSEIFQALGPPTVSNNAATGVAITNATVGGELLGGGIAQASIYWGLTDGGSNATSWLQTNALGAVLWEEPFATDITTLAGGTYYYRCYITNYYGHDWADSSLMFTTLQATVSIRDPSPVPEGSVGLRSVDFDVSLSHASASNMLVYYTVSNGTAEAGMDYVESAGVLSIPSGDTNGLITVDIKGDRVNEWPYETFYLVVTNVRHCAIQDNSAVGIITDDDISTGKWKNKMKITFSGYTPPDPPDDRLTNFPALVVFSTNMPDFAYDQFSSQTGSDLRFKDSRESQMLDFEIEEWDTNGSSYVWVRVPEISGPDSHVWAFWGNADVTDLPSSTSYGTTWNPGYRGVWHLDHIDGSADLRDSSTNLIHGTDVNNSADIEGKISHAQNFVRSYDQLIELPDVAGPLAFTLTAWIKSPDSTVRRGIFGWNSRAFAIENDGKLLYGEDDGGWKTHVSTDTVDDNTFRHVAITTDGVTARLFIDGLQNGGTGLVDLNPPTSNMRIGNTGLSSDDFEGVIDEVRFSDVVRSPDWIWACCMNTASNSTFNTYEMAAEPGLMLIVR
jgi:hypothetical protein